MKLVAYIARRLLLAIPVLLGVSFITFGIAWIANEGKLYRAFITDRMSLAQREAIIVNGGFDQPWYVQYFKYLERLVEFDLGFSHSQQGLPIREVLKAFFPPTLELTLIAMVFAIIFGISLGVLSAVRKDKPVDQLARVVALSGVSLPIFWLGLILKLVFATTFGNEAVLELGVIGQAVFLFIVFGLVGALVLVLVDIVGWSVKKRAWSLLLGGIAIASLAAALTPFAPALVNSVFAVIPQFPLGGQFSNELVQVPGEHPSLTSGPTKFLLLDTLLAGDWVAFKDVVWHLVLPGVTLGYATMAIITRMMRSSMLETLTQDYVRTAHAKGLSESEVLRRHVRRNALLPTTTAIGLSFGGLLGGAVLTETIFQWPGMGRWSTQAITSSDTNSIMVFTLLVTLAYLLVNLAVDIAYAAIDPRVRLE